MNNSKFFNAAPGTRDLVPLLLTICSFLSILIFANEPFVDSLPDLLVQIVGLYFVLSWLIALTLVAASFARIVKSIISKQLEFFPFLLLLLNIIYFFYFIYVFLFRE